MQPGGRVRSRTRGEMLGAWVRGSQKQEKNFLLFTSRSKKLPTAPSAQKGYVWAPSCQVPPHVPGAGLMVPPLLSVTAHLWAWIRKTLPCQFVFLKKIHALARNTTTPAPVLGPEDQMWIRNKHLGFPGGAVVKHLPANAGDTGSSPGPGRSHMPRSS